MCDNFLYGFKGARSAPGPGWPPPLSRRARGWRWSGRGAVPAGHQAGLPGNVARLGAACRS